MSEIKTPSLVSPINTTTWLEDIELLSFFLSSTTSTTSLDMCKTVVKWFRNETVKKFITVMIRKAVEASVKSSGHVLDLELKLDSKNPDEIRQSKLQYPYKRGPAPNVCVSMDVILSKEKMENAITILIAHNFTTSSPCRYNVFVIDICYDTFSFDIYLLVKSMAE